MDTVTGQFEINCMVAKCDDLYEEVLKGQCHEDFVVLGKFCTKIITSRL